MRHCRLTIGAAGRQHHGVTGLLLKSANALFSALPYPVIQRLGAGLGWFLGRVVRHRRAIVREALARSLPERTAAERERIADGMYRHLATLVLECLHFAGRRAGEFVTRADVVGRENLEAVRSRGGGALLLMGHIGNWELTGPAYAQMWRPVNVVVRPIQNRAINDYWRKARATLELSLLPREDALRDCMKALKRRETVALVLDQNMRRHRGIFVDFFGRPACTTPGLALLSVATRTPVLPIFMLRLADGRHQLHLLPPIEPPPDRSEESIRVATQHYTRVLEDIIRAHPDQWTWIHKRWRTRPESDQAETPRK